MQIKWFRSLSSVFSILLWTIFTVSAAQAAESLSIVENEKVCMVTDMHFPKKQIPVSHNGKTYFGCCENCKETLAKDAKARTAVDPLSGKSVDKAKAVIAARPDHSVLYFESKKNFDSYIKKTAAPSESATQNHSHH